MTLTVAGRPWLAPIALDPETDRDAWMLDRLRGLGGSDAAAIVGESPFKTGIDVWQERVTGVPNALDNERAEVGRLLEGPILEWYAHGSPRWPRVGGPVAVRKPPTVYHRDRPWHRGSADGLAYETEVVACFGEGVDLLSAPTVPDHAVEVKTHGWFAGRAYETTDEGVPVDVPGDKRIQVAWYLSLYDLPWAALCALIDTHQRRTYVIERDRELEATLLEECDRFWRRYVLTGEPPPADGSPSYAAWLKQRFKTHRAELLPTTPEIDAEIVRLKKLKRIGAKIDDARELCEQRIKGFIGDALGIDSPISKVTWKAQRSGKLHEKAARAELYTVAGWTDAEIREFEKRHATPDHRVLRTP